MKVEVFFDYNCPYCYKGHKQLKEFSAQNPGLEIIWVPCEISIYKNPSQPTHGDISLQGMFFVQESGGDLWAYHDRVYDLVFEKSRYGRDAAAFAEAMGVDGLRQALESGKYLDKLAENNHYAFKESKVHVVPTYRRDGGFLQDRQEFYGMGDSDTAYGGKS